MKRLPIDYDASGKLTGFSGRQNAISGPRKAAKNVAHFGFKIAETKTRDNETFAKDFDSELKNSKNELLENLKNTERWM